MLKAAFRNVALVGVLLSLAAPVLAGDPVEIRLKDGSRWKGEVSDFVQLTWLRDGVSVELKGRLVKEADLFITVETEIAGEIRLQAIFKREIAKMTTLARDPLTDLRPTGPQAPAATRGDGPAHSDQPGVFVLPLGGMVGLEFRHEEIDKVAEEADKYGPGQIIVLIIDSGGGGVEMFKIHDTLKEIKKRHRVVAWIKQAISAACATAVNCHEIYFMTEGTAGAMTGFNGATGQALKGEILDEWLRAARDWMEEGGRSPYIADAMITAKSLLSWTKDPQTGEVKFFNDLSGEKILSDENTNLVFTASTALECGFSDGTADTQEQLARLLDLPAWREISDLGRRLARDWTATVEQGNRELRLLASRLEYKGSGSGDPVEVLATRIHIYEEVIRWIDRCPNCAMMAGVPSKETIERDVKDLRMQLSALKKSQRP